MTVEIKNIETAGFKTALRGMRNPKNSWNRGDTNLDRVATGLGENDKKLAQMLISGGPPHSKFLRMIYVGFDIICPTYFAAEFDTYKINTVRNSCSLQHKGASRDFVIQDFILDDEGTLSDRDLRIFFENKLLPVINYLRQKYVETKDYKYFRQMRQLIPMGYNYRFTWSGNYENLRNMIKWRQAHPLQEWRDFVEQLHQLPYADQLLFYDNKPGKE